jgi:hypothetical protein
VGLGAFVEPAKHNFEIGDDVVIVAPYDYTSIMHYDGCNDSKCDACPQSGNPTSCRTCSSCSANDLNCRVITTLDPDAQSIIGLLDEWGAGDRAKLQAVYGVGLCAYAAPGLANGDGSLNSPASNLTVAAAVAAGGTVWCRRGSVFTAEATLALPATYNVHGNGQPVILN